MLWEGKRLRDLHEADLRQVIQSGLGEHLHLEYKSEMYEANDRGNKESLLDICMFANAEGGVLLICVPELRDAVGQPTGVPDPAGNIGLPLNNPESVLQALDARVTASIEERLKLESTAIRLANGEHVLALRIPNSTAKPHCVRYQGRVYFPSRRERSRYEMDVREIKELVMRTSSQLEKSQNKLQETLRTSFASAMPYLLIGAIPIFGQEFLIDLKKWNIRQAVAAFDALNTPPQVANVKYVFAGLERQQGPYDNTVQVQRSGLVWFRRQLPVRKVNGVDTFYPTAIDLQLRKFTLRAGEFYAASDVSGPYLLGMSLDTRGVLAGLYVGPVPGVDDQTDAIPPGYYSFPVMLVDDFGDIDSIILALCDHAHQAFGRSASPYFNADGQWIGPA